MVDEWGGEKYANIAELQHTLATAALDVIDWDPRATVIDLGCGDGVVTTEIALRVPEGNVLGIDPSEKQIDFAVANHVLPNLRFAVGDATTFEVNPARNVLTSFYALHWVHDLEQAAQRIFDALYPGGIVLMQHVGSGERQSLEETIALTSSSERWAQYFLDYQQPFEHRSDSEWNQLLVAAGFDDIEVHVEDIAWDFGDRAGFRAWCLGTFGAWTARLPEDRIDAFINEVLDAYATVIGRDGLFKFSQFRITARRP